MSTSTGCCSTASSAPWCSAASSWPLGVAIVSTFTAVLFVFGAILIYSAIKLLKDDDDSIDPGKSFAVRLLRKLVPVSDEYRGTKFFYKEAGKRIATPLLAVVVAIEAADLIFAVDSVPAVLAVSDNTFIIYSSNAFAILGLRALYFLLAGMLKKFHYLGKGLAFILAFIGVKLFLQAGHKVISTSIPEIPSLVSLGVIILALTVSIVASLRNPLPDEEIEGADESPHRTWARAPTRWSSTRCDRLGGHRREGHSRAGRRRHWSVRGPGPGGLRLSARPEIAPSTTSDDGSGWAPPAQPEPAPDSSSTPDLGGAATRVRSATG